MKDLGQFEISRFDTAITDENHAGGTALIAESAAHDSKVTLIMPSMSVSQIVNCLLASAQESRKDMDIVDIEDTYQKSVQPTVTPEILRIKIDYENKMLIIDAGSGLLYFRLSQAVLHDKGLCVWDVASIKPEATILSPKESSSS